MVRKVFGVYDSKAGVFMSPFVCIATGEAIRMFSDAVNEPQTSVARHPEDYRLFHLADFDDSNGMFVPLEKPVALGYGTDFVSKDKVAEKFPVVSVVPPKKAV